jgi:hypothetical protein
MGMDGMVPTAYYQVQGFPTGISSTTVATSLKEWGWDVIPVKQWSFSPGMICWLVGGCCEPPGEYISVQDFMVAVVSEKTIAEKRASADHG